MSLLLTVAWTTSQAYDFMADGIAYNINDDGITASVTSKTGKYTGDITIPETVTWSDKTYLVSTIGKSAFYRCWDLNSVIIPKSISTIEETAFYDCRNLAAIVIPENVSSICVSAFHRCTGLSHVTYNAKRCSGPTADEGPDSEEDFAWFKDSKLTELSIGDKVEIIPESLAYYQEGLTSITIPNSVSLIGKEAFAGCKQLTSITIPDSVTLIGNGAFSSCEQLKSVKLGDSVSSIGENAFRRCSSLSEIVFPTSVSFIDYGAFSMCNSLSSITLPSTIAGLGFCVFGQCQNLTEVYYNVTDCEGGNDPAYSLFIDCPLEHVYIGENVKTIPSHFLWGQAKLASVIIPNSVTAINSFAFSGCEGLTSIIIPQNVSTIRNMAFYGCNNLTAITSLNVQPPVIDAITCFSNSTYSNATLYVPKGSLSAYSTANDWRKFSNIVELSCKLGDINGDNTVDVSDVNIVINSILGKNDQNNTDVNEDNVTDVSDLNIIISIILGKDKRNDAL